ncbi:unnamed protein product [Adineta steineri]|uniref:RING-type domain-containing protein n=1 Tax=Adineta steineri TaxID=433720 RepID=A0A815B9K6_9BILA|nr:unnamed protein product [Adineta steineri]CAF1269324.1 unnamed protein product [Adineta steineri]
MGIYYSVISLFSSPTETDNRNVQTNSKYKKRRRRRQKQQHLLNQFYLGSKHFLVNTQPNTCLFNEYYYSNSRKDSLNPIHLHISLPETNHSTITHPIQCTIAIRRDSLKLIHCHDDYCSIDFTFDADCPVQIYIYFMAHELYTNNNGSLSYVCCEKTNYSNTFKQSYAFIRSAGHGQIFSSILNDIRFPLSILRENHHNCTMKNRVYPLVIICRELNKNSTTTTTTSFPTFDQFHIVLATIKLLRLNDTTLPITLDRVSVVLLNQKHVYNGIVFKLFELYGIENYSSKSSKTNQQNKSLIQIISTSNLNENEPFLNSSSNLDISLNESTCVICLTDIRNVLLLPCRHICLCSSCAENLKFQSTNCPICRIPFRALLQMNALYCQKNSYINENNDDDDLIFENMSLIDALNLSTIKQINKQTITTNDMKYFCSEHSV